MGLKRLTFQCCLILAVVFFTACSDFPKDTEQSFDEAKAHQLKLGLIENPPYVNFKNGRYSGIEIQLIEDYADRNNLDIHYIEGTESQLIEKLEAFQLHIVAGGFDKKTIWKSKVGISSSYDGSHVFLVPKGENQLLYRLEKYIFEKQ